MTNPKILIVDDEPGTLQILRAHLEREGFSVLTAADGPAAVKAARAGAAQAGASHGAYGVGAMNGEAALPEAASLAALTDAQRWDVVAALYALTTTPAELARSAALFERDCTGCYGLDSQGEGPGAAALAQPAMQGEQHAGMAMDRPRTDFTDLAAQAGASDLLYYGRSHRQPSPSSLFPSPPSLLPICRD